MDTRRDWEKAFIQKEENDLERSKDKGRSLAPNITDLRVFFCFLSYLLS